jgi:peptidyl-dipeptidase Dcp
MRKSLITVAVSAAFMLSACQDNSVADSNMTTQAPASQTTSAVNVLLTASPLQDFAPQFDQIKASDFVPAFTQGMAEHKAEIDAIINNSEPASFDNTLVALEKSGALLNRTQRAFFTLSGLISDDDFIQIEQDMVPLLTSHEDSIYLDAKLFAKIDAIYQAKATLTGEDLRLIEVYYDQFVRAGAKLGADDKNKMRELNGKLAKLETNFSQNILKSFKNDVILVQDKAQLAGLSDDTIASLAAAANAVGKTGYMITLVNTTTQPLLSSLENRELRQKIWETSAYRAMDTNAPLNIKIAQLRAEKAALLGFKDWASYSVADQMAKTPEAVYGILDDLAPKALAKAKIEAADIQAEIKKDGKDFKLQAWDWAYYGDKVRQTKLSRILNLILCSMTAYSSP